MEDVREVVQRAAEVGAKGSDRAALRALSRHQPSVLHAAFAYAKRRRTDPSMEKAADALEIALVMRHRGALQGARWWHRVEVLWVSLVLMHAVNLSNAFEYGVWVTVGSVMALLLLTVLVVRWWSRRIESGHVAVQEVDTAPASAGRIPELRAAVLRAGRHAFEVEDGGVAEAAAAMRSAAVLGDHPHADLLGVAALSAAEKGLAGGLQRHRSQLLAAAGAAREGLLAEVRTDRLAG